MGLSKASSFDMTLMFMDSQEKKDITEIIKTLKSHDSVDKSALSKLESTYKS